MSEDYILLAKTKTKSGKEFYFLPGGHIEHLESIKETSIRELKEEIGVNRENVNNVELIGVFENSWSDGGDPYHEINFISKCDIYGISHKEKVISQESHLSFEWHDLKSINDVELLPMAFKSLIPKFLKNKNKQGDFFESGIV